MQSGSFASAEVSPQSADSTPMPLSPAAAVAAPPTPLQQRSWQRLAQRSVRLAVTAFKDATARFADANATGTTVATQLTNSILSQYYVSDMQLPAVLQEVQDLQAASVTKLHRQQEESLQQLQELYWAMELSVQDMAAAADDVQRQMDDSNSSWQASVPVFHTLSLTESANLLKQILDMYQQELAVKQQLLTNFQQAVDEASLQLPGKQVTASSSSTGKGKKEQSVDEIKKQLTAAITTWMVRPCIEDEQVLQLLQVLTDDMVGF